MRTSMEAGERLRRRFEADSKLVQRQVSIAEQEHENFKTCSFDLDDFAGRQRAPQHVLQEPGVAREREIMTQGMPSLASMISPLNHLHRGFTLPHNLVNGSVLYEPHNHFVVRGEASLPDDIDQRFFFERLASDPSGRKHTFALNSIFPLVSTDAGELDTTHTTFHYRFTFPVGSPGTYAFLPQAEVVGSVGYATQSGTSPGSFWMHVAHGVTVGDRVLGGTQTNYWTELGDGEIRPIVINPYRLLMDDSGFGPVSVQLDPNDGDAHVDVWIILGFRNGPSDAYVTNPDGHFVLDCESAGGKVSCLLVKWGMQ